MMSPTFECSMEGLRSAVRLRAVVQGRPDPDSVADWYMTGASRDARLNDPAALRARIVVVISDIEHLTSVYPTS